MNTKKNWRRWLKVIVLGVLCTIGGTRASNNLTTDNTLVLWDINQVIVKPGDMKGQAKSYKHIRKVFWNPEISAWSNMKILGTLVSKVGKIGVRKMKLGLFPQAKEGFFEYLIDMAESTTPEHRYLKGFAYRLGTTQVVIPETAEIIRQLDKAGFKQALGSNIGQRIFDKMVFKDAAHKAFKKEFELFELFDRDFSYIATVDDFKSGSVKPNSRFYDKVLAKIDAADPGMRYKYIVFVDDHPANIVAAEKMNGVQSGRIFIGIQFKGAADLEQQLVGRGMLT